MDNTVGHLALVIVALLGPRLCIAQEYAVPQPCFFHKTVNSTAENELQGMTLKDCVVEDGDMSNTSFCVTAPGPNGSTRHAVRHDCLCGGKWETIRKVSHLDCDSSICCKTKIWHCRNGGKLTCIHNLIHQCSCAYPFHGDRCQYVKVTRECSPNVSTPGLQSCESSGESKTMCLYTVNQNQLQCGLPVSESDVSNLAACSMIYDRGVLTENNEVNSVTEIPDQDSFWSNWSPWSVCQMPDNAQSKGPCKCRKGECEDGSCTGFGIEVTNCTEHGHWTPWTPWSACSTTRGRTGERTRYRFCSNPSPKYDGKPCEGPDNQKEACSQDHQASGPNLQMTNFSSWANMTFEDEVPGWLKVRTKLVCQSHESELKNIKAGEVAESCYLLKVSVEHCHENDCVPLKGLRKLINKSFIPEN
ncbi:SCO-spondin-like [Ylistrum balloti]|uniref:SCO-spondin-like n=1 Tax=Ylistrum balloti TaxID=509963 RepID=UPI002905D68F|nr:SCO-spondin-like [Ylistrum balloti]XP_060074797.1 SCO-spondin-like [Ylistrum balloti]XP_060074798.1 SCO-spondin-like [Ylistrum balloti]